MTILFSVFATKKTTDVSRTSLLQYFFITIASKVILLTESNVSSRLSIEINILQASAAFTRTRPKLEWLTVKYLFANK